MPIKVIVNILLIVAGIFLSIWGSAWIDATIFGGTGAFTAFFTGAVIAYFSTFVFAAIVGLTGFNPTGADNKAERSIRARIAVFGLIALVLSLNWGGLAVLGTLTGLLACIYRLRAAI